MKTLPFATFFTITFAALSGQKQQCPCTSRCYNSRPPTYDDYAYDTQQISCLGGYECEVAQVKCADGIAYCPPKVICQSVCKNIECPENRTCELVRAENPPGSGNYVIVPTCFNPCNPEGGDLLHGSNYYCQLQVVKNSCSFKGKPCTVEAVTKNECCNDCRNITCGNGAYGRCYDKPLSCPIGPCQHTYECRVPCSKTHCKTHYHCIEDNRYTCAPGTCCPPPGEICIPWLP